MNILIMGAAGSGKGTMAKKILECYDIPHISTGNMFRAAIAEGTELGRSAQRFMEQGLLVPDEVTIAMVGERLMKEDCQRGYLLDGFPRTLDQALAFEKISASIGKPVEAVISLDVDLDELAPRITGRRMCPSCGAIYHIANQPPKVDGVCDVDGSVLVHRKDDTIEQLAVRLKEHATMTTPVLHHYSELNLVHNVDASREIDAVWADVHKILKKLK
jgi:adenylate kinase